MLARLTIIGVLTGLLAGCAGFSPEEVRARDVRACDEYGFERGTNAFAECLQRRDIARDLDRPRAGYPGRHIYRPGIGLGAGLVF